MVTHLFIHTVVYFSRTPSFIIKFEILNVHNVRYSGTAVLCQDPTTRWRHRAQHPWRSDYHSPWLYQANLGSLIQLFLFPPCWGSLYFRINAHFMRLHKNPSLSNAVTVYRDLSKLRTRFLQITQNTTSNQSPAFPHAVVCALETFWPTERWSLCDRAEQGLLSLQIEQALLQQLGPPSLGSRRAERLQLLDAQKQQRQRGIHLFVLCALCRLSKYFPGLFESLMSLLPARDSPWGWREKSFQELYVRRLLDLKWAPGWCGCRLRCQRHVPRRKTQRRRTSRRAHPPWHSSLMWPDPCMTTWSKLSRARQRFWKHHWAGRRDRCTTLPWSPSMTPVMHEWTRNGWKFDSLSLISLLHATCFLSPKLVNVAPLRFALETKHTEKWEMW